MNNSNIILDKYDIIIWSDGTGYFEVKIPTLEYQPNITGEQIKQQILENQIIVERLRKELNLNEEIKQIEELYDDFNHIESRGVAGCQILNRLKFVKTIKSILENKA